MTTAATIPLAAVASALASFIDGSDRDAPTLDSVSVGTVDLYARCQPRKGCRLEVRGGEFFSSANGRQFSGSAAQIARDFYEHVRNQHGGASFPALRAG